MKCKPFWVVTSFYNPGRSRRRIENYFAFRRNLDAPLLVIELAEQGEHQLSADDAEVLVKVAGNARIWQKERLLNIALGELPDKVEFVAWIDCDVVFGNPDWIDEAQSLLQSSKLFVQLFDTVTHMPPQLSPESASPDTCADARALFCEHSFASSYLSGDYTLASARPSRAELEDAASTPDILPISHGIGWAGHKDVLQEVGWYDACVIGGGDKAMALATIGRADILISERPMTESHVDHYRAWAEQLCEGNADRLGVVSGSIFHLWHGRYRRRNYVDRHHILKQLAFDPSRDLALSQNGTWRWTPNAQALQAAVGEYFSKRLEDQL